MTENEFKLRTKQIALRVINVAAPLPRTSSADIPAKQLLRSGTSIGANYRAACRVRSTADIINKLAIVEEQANESMYWIKLLIDAGIVPAAKLSARYRDIDEIVAMTVASIKTVRSKISADPKSKIQNRND